MPTSRRAGRFECDAVYRRIGRDPTAYGRATAGRPYSKPGALRMRRISEHPFYPAPHPVVGVGVLDDPCRTHRLHCRSRANPQSVTARRRAGRLRPPLTGSRIPQAGASQPALRPDWTKYGFAGEWRKNWCILRGLSRAPAPAKHHPKQSVGRGPVPRRCPAGTRGGPGMAPYNGKRRTPP